jgi:hypothetical protein
MHLHFEGRLASGPDDICDLFAKCIQQTNTDDVWMPSDPGPYLVPYEPPFQGVLLALDVSKGAAPDGIPFVILKISFFFFNMS